MFNYTTFTMKYEVIRISNSNEDYLRITKEDSVLQCLVIRSNNFNYRSFEQAYDEALEYIRKDSEPVKEELLITIEK